MKSWSEYLEEQVAESQVKPLRKIMKELADEIKKNPNWARTQYDDSDIALYTKFRKVKDGMRMGEYYSTHFVFNKDNKLAYISHYAINPNVGDLIFVPSIQKVLKAHFKNHKYTEKFSNMGSYEWRFVEPFDPTDL